MNEINLTQTNRSAPLRSRSHWHQRLYDRYGIWAVVTGASSGIGREMALECAIAGLNLVLVARRQSILEQMQQDLIRQYGIEVRAIALDLAQTNAVPTLVANIQGLQVGLLVAAAGFGTSGLFHNASLDREIEMLNLNCRSLMELCWHLGGQFLQQRRGGMVLMSSIVGFQGMPYAAHYAATKAYVQTLAEALAVEFAPLEIDVIASAPGPTRSGFADRAGMKMGQTVDPAVVARATLQALGRQSLILPAFLSKLLVYSLVPLPRWARVRIMGKVMQGMTQPGKLHSRRQS